MSTDPDSQNGKNAPLRVKVGIEKVFFYPGHDFAVDHMWWDVALIRLTDELTFNGELYAIFELVYLLLSLICTYNTEYNNGSLKV